MEIKINNKNGIILQTKHKYCDDNITIKLEDRLFSNVLKIVLDNTKNASYFFNEYDDYLEGLFDYNDFENVTDFSYTFGNSKVRGDFSINTKSAVNLFHTFEYCPGLTSIKLNTDNVQDFTYAFLGCSYLGTIDLTTLDSVTSSAKMGNAFGYCRRMTKLIIRNMTKVPPLATNSLQHCYRLTGTVNETYNPDGLHDGRIYVPDDFVEQLKSATNWSEFADVIVPLSTLEE